MFQIDALSRTPVYLQLVEQTERLILSGVLTPGQQMPSVRNLSIALSVNPNTIQKAYSELDSHGLTCAVPGRGCFVTATASWILLQQARRQLPELFSLVQKLKISGVTKEEILQCVQDAYESEPHKTRKEGSADNSGTIPDQTI